MKLFGRDIRKQDWLRASLAVPLVLAAQLGAGYFAERYALMLESTVSGCLPWSVYFWNKQEQIGTLKRYDLVLFPAKKMMPVLADGAPVGKLVAGLPGDQITVKNGRLYINGRFLGDVSYVARKWHKPMDSWDTSYRLGKDEIFVYGTEKHSYDSRYWGPYSIGSVVGRMHVLF